VLGVWLGFGVGVGSWLGFGVGVGSGLGAGVGSGFGSLISLGVTVALPITKVWI